MPTLRFIIILLLGSLAAPTAAQPTQWEFRAPMTTPRTGIAAAVLDGKIYVLGGQDRFGAVLDAASRYDPQLDLWESLPAMDKARVNAAAVAFEGNVYVLGGRDGNGDVLDDVAFYDPFENRWQSFESLEIERQGLAAVLRDTSLFVAGGSNEDDEILDSIEFYDKAQGAWTEFEEDGEEVEVTGTIEALGEADITVEGTTFAVTEATEILDESDNPITLADLAVGMVVQIRGVRDVGGVLIATRIKIEDRGEEPEEVALTGTIEALGGASITVDGMTFAVTDTTEILDEDDNPITLADLAVGMIVEIRGVRYGGGMLIATRIKVEDQGGGGGLGELEFCESTIDLNVGDAFNVRDYVQVKDDPAALIDWALAFFTYTEAGANNPTTPPDWNLATFNAGQPVTVVAADTAAGTGNQGRGEYRVYVVRQGQAVFDDHVTFRIDDERDSEVEDARCQQGGGAAGKHAAIGSLGVPRAAFAAVTVDEAVLFLGGFGQRGPLDLVQRLRPDGRFEFLAALPSARGSLAAAALHDSVFVMGGLDGSLQVLADVQLLDPLTGTWKPMPRLNNAREGSAAAAVDGVLYVIGGRDAAGRVLDSVESFGQRGVAVEEIPEPLDFRLAQNYPNPFQGGTTISFSVSAQASGRRVVLSVYDVQGRRVAVLVDGALAPGAHEVTWDGLGRDGAPAGSGVYFYRLQQGDWTARKMMARVR